MSKWCSFSCLATQTSCLSLGRVKPPPIDHRTSIDYGRAPEGLWLWINGIMTRNWIRGQAKRINSSSLVVYVTRLSLCCRPQRTLEATHPRRRSKEVDLGIRGRTDAEDQSLVFAPHWPDMTGWWNPAQYLLNTHVWHVHKESEGHTGRKNIVEETGASSVCCHHVLTIMKFKTKRMKSMAHGIQRGGRTTRRPTRTASSFCRTHCVCVIEWVRAVSVRNILNS